MTESNFTTHGDQELEARIVAWVLGEASAFEAAELKRLCAERPELAVFKRRIQAVHGLLGEAAHPLPAQVRKLPEAKRQVILSLMDPQEIHATREAARETRVLSSARRALLAIAACVIITLIALPLMTIKHGVMMSKEVPMIVSYSVDTNSDAFESASRRENALPLSAPMRPPAADESSVDPFCAPAEQSGGNIERKPVAVAKQSKGKSRPSKPNSSSAKVVASTAPSPVPVPTPEAAEPPLTLDATDGVSFGQGWGAVGGSARAVVMPKAREGGAQEEMQKQVASAAEKLESNSLAHAAPAPGAPAATAANAPQMESVPPGQGDFTVMGRVFARDKELGNSGITAGMRLSDESITRSEVDSVLDQSKTLNLKPDNDANYRYSLADGKKGERLAQGAVPAPAESLSGGQPGAFKTTDGKDMPGDEDLRRQRIDKVEGADGLVDLGRYDEAKKGYEDALRQNPMDPAARRGLEKVAEAKSEYFRTAYDHTRAELLSRVDAAWGLDAPGDKARDADERGTLALQEFGRDSRVDDKGIHLTKPAEDIDFVGSFANFGAPIQSGPAGQLADVREGGIKEDLTQFFEMKSGSEIAAVLRGGVAVDPLSQVIGGERENKVEPEVKAPTPLDGEVVAAEEPYSTFSLNVSDASFQVAQAALAKGEMPDPAGIKVEQFYNAVDYGDPSPAAGEPVTARIEQAAHPQLPGRTLVRVAVKTGASGRNQGQPLRLTLLVDQSGSMSREDRLAGMNKALAGLATLLTPQDRVQVIGFSRNARLLAEDLNGQQAANIGSLIHQEASEGGTNLEEAMALGEQIAQRTRLEGAQNRIVLFTDGAANLGDADPASLTKRVEAMRQKGIAFDIAGIVADGLNDELLGDLARHGNGRYYVVGKGDRQDLAAQLAGAFRPAAENVKVQVHFNPERVSRYRLVGFEKDRLNKEDFRNDAVDAAEMAAEEAGVAIYQVETLPEGKGEMGEVSVRFRDVASGQMVERGWTLTHQDKVPVLDRSTPSMQLAVLAMLAGEKLKGGPLADAVNFKEMAPVAATVREAYQQNDRVAELLQMIEQLK